MSRPGRSRNASTTVLGNLPCIVAESITLTADGASNTSCAVRVAVIVTWPSEVTGALPRVRAESARAAESFAVRDCANTGATDAPSAMSMMPDAASITTGADRREREEDDRADVVDVI